MSLPARVGKLLLVCLLGTGLGLGAALAVDVNGQLEDPALQSRFEDIAKQLRCLVCQNESIADSNATLAEELRQEVREMLVAGKTDGEIFDFMTARYGEFVRYNPPLEGKTYLIWGAPFVLLIGGGFAVWRIARARAQLPLDLDDGAPSGEA